jgi:hypothetical protein
VFGHTFVEILTSILERQLPDSEKRLKADFILDTVRDAPLQFFDWKVALMDMCLYIFVE